MHEVEEQLKDLCREMIREKKVQTIIGYTPGPLPLTVTPYFVSDVKQCDNLIWNDQCDLNLVKTLPKSDSKIGIVVKLCDLKSLIVLFNENQLARENVAIIVVPCAEGIIDKKKILRLLKGKELLDASSKEMKIELKVHDGLETVDKLDVLGIWCKSCDHELPPVYDHIFDLPDKYKSRISQTQDEITEVLEFEKYKGEERWTYFTSSLEACIRCNACRNACPLCYCKECFVDQNVPQWFGKSSEVSENFLFHLVRAIHLAGRCVGCGACTRACPLDIDLHLINKKIRQIAKDRFHHEPGKKLGVINPFATYSMEDEQDFIVTKEGGD